MIKKPINPTKIKYNLRKANNKTIEESKELIVATFISAVIVGSLNNIGINVDVEILAPFLIVISKAILARFRNWRKNK